MACIGFVLYCVCNQVALVAEEHVQCGAKKRNPTMGSFLAYPEPCISKLLLLYKSFPLTRTGFSMKVERTPCKETGTVDFLLR